MQIAEHLNVPNTTTEGYICKVHAKLLQHTRIGVWKLSLARITPCQSSITGISNAYPTNGLIRPQQHTDSPIGGLVGDRLNHSKLLTFNIYRTIFPPCPASIFCDLRCSDKLLEPQYII